MQRFMWTLGISLALVFILFASLGSRQDTAVFSFQIMDAETGQGLACGKVLTLQLHTELGEDPIWKFDGGEFNADSNGFVDLYLGEGNYDTQVVCEGYPVYVETGQVIVHAGFPHYMRGSHDVELKGETVVLELEKIDH